MSKQLSQVIASRLNLQPALISPTFGDMVSSSLRQMYHASEDDEEKQQIQSRKNILSVYGYSYETRSEEKPFAYADGIAFIPVSGLLINRFSRSWGWVTGYNYLREMLNLALQDDDVKLIVFDCNSGGGEVSGCFELCADIRASRDVKPSVAVVDSSSYSACYAIASSASRIVVTPSGGVGSIGVVAMHIDYSKYLSDAGISIEFIFSGDHKVDGNPYEPLPEPVRKSIKSRVEAIRKDFVTLVAANRSLDFKVVFDTQAACYTASEALDLGLIDAVAPPIEAVRSSLFELTGSVTLQETEMSNKATTETKPGGDNTASSANQTTTTADTASVSSTVDTKAVVGAERARIKAITGHESAKDKSALANHLALNTDLSVDAAAEILAAASVEQTEATDKGQSAFSAAMNAGEHPNVGADASGGEGLTVAQQILRAQELATGVKHV